MLKCGGDLGPLRSLLVFLGFGVDVSEDDDVREVDPEPAEQRGHPGWYDGQRVYTIKHGRGCP